MGLEHGDRRKRLRNAGDAEEGVGCDPLLLVPVGVAEAAGVDELPVPGDGERPAGDGVLLEEAGHESVERRERLGGGERGA